MAESDPFLETQLKQPHLMSSGDQLLHFRRKKKVKAPPTNVGYFELFRFAEPWDYFLISIAVFTSLLRALTHPICILVYSELVAMFIDRHVGIGTSSITYVLPIFGGGAVLTNATHAENMEELKNDSLAFGIIISLNAVLMFVSGVLSIDIFNHVALTLTARLRKLFFETTIRQDIGWHDTAKDQNFALRITDNMEKIRNGIAENVSHFLMLIFDIVICVAISFGYGWKLTLAVFGYIPLAIVINVLVAKYQTKLTSEEQNSYANASTVVEESVGAIRTVVAFGGENEEANRFEKRLIPGWKAGIRRGVFSGLSDASLKAMLFLCSAAAFWYGSYLIVADRFKDPYDRDYTPAVLMIVLTGIIVSADHISRTVPFLEGFAMARGSAKAIYDVIDREPEIDPLSEEGKTLNTPLTGNIQFEDVFFRYPSRQDVIVLRGLNFNVKEGQTVALVGHSGCGKSTCIQLILRFYDPDFGKIMIDGLDVRKYNVGWLRQNIAVVGQEPVLFFGTIGENIRHGKPNATQKEVEEAAKAAGAHDFITKLPEDYNTMISEKGVQLSGGQRQRIAIARALIKNPRILLLDEATSALDYHSEKLVQAALDKASIGRTTIVVSHRLSAIKNADHIIFLDAGKIVEQGSHEELIRMGGKYSEMINVHASDDNELKSDDEDLHKENNDDTTDTERLSSHRESSISLDTEKLKNHLSPLEKRKSTAGKPYTYMGTFFRLLKTARQQWCFLAIGTIGAAIYGCTQPAFAIVCANFYGALAVPTDQELLSGTSIVAILSTVVGIIAGIAGFTQTYLFNLAGVALTTRMRSVTFRTVLKQEVGWFDRKENSVGAISARLAGDAANVQSAVGFPLSNIIQALTNFLCSVTIALLYSLKLSLVCLITAPFMIASVIFEARFVAKSTVREKELLEDTSRIATEAISQIRTVATLNRERALIVQYDKDLAEYMKAIKRRLRYRGVINSSGMSIMFVGYAITIAYGGIMVAENEIKFEDVMKIANSLLYGLFLLAQSLAFTPAFNAAIISAGRLFQIVDREPQIVSPSVQTNGRKLQNGGLDKKPSSLNTVDGVSWQDIEFTYPTRPDHRVLSNFNLEVHQGQTVALVGPSGSGKSTCVQLLLRYYDPIKGTIFIDQENIHRDLTLPKLRSHLGIVSQEPSLFEKTIAENIAYGDTTREVAMSEIIAAAKMANAHEFIVTLPNGYETKMGARGTQLSGGQKQRIAIARALVRNPKILLLDEATSALDLQSERTVQLALDEACAGRTCIVIAHRLSTVQNADLICVLRNGHIVERGNHAELLAKNGVYAKLHRTQPKAH